MKAGIDYTGVCVVFYCHDGEGNFLFHQRSQNCRDNQGDWDMGGGGLEWGEDPTVGVLREVREEYGCEGKINERLPYYSLLRENAGIPTHWIALPFIIQVSHQEAKLNDPGAMESLQWFQLDALPQPLHPGNIFAFKNYGEILESFAKGKKISLS